jgi:hypothetical protein
MEVDDNWEAQAACGVLQDHLQSCSADSQRPLNLSWGFGWEQRGGDGGRWPAASYERSGDSVNEREKQRPHIFMLPHRSVLEPFPSNMVGPTLAGAFFAHAQGRGAGDGLRSWASPSPLPSSSDRE